MLGRHPSCSLLRGECTTMLSRHPSHSLSRGGTTTLGHHPPPNLLHPSRSQSCRGCTTTLGRHSPSLALAIVWGVCRDVQPLPTPRARSHVGGVPRRSAATYHPSCSQLRGGCTTMLRHCPPATPLVLAIAWGVYHDTRPLPTSAAPHTRNRVGGVPRRSVATHHPSRLQLRGGCTATLGHHLGHPSRSQSRAGCTSAHHPPPAPLALASAWGVYSPTLGPTPPPAPLCSQLHGGVYHNALPVHCLI
jgi:hypothetical protein